jgi:hypothetical protein
MNLIGRILILVTITGILSFGLIAIVNNTSTSTGFDQGEPPQRIQVDQTGTTTQLNASRPPRMEGGFDGERGTGSFIEIGKGLGIFALITLVVVLIQKGFTKVFRRKQMVSG